MKAWTLWRTKIWRTFASLFASPKRVHYILRAAETAILSLELQPMAVGWCSDIDQMMSWLVVHVLKCRLKAKGEDIAVLEVSELNYMPLDPFNLFSDEAKAAMMPLDQLGLTNYRKKVAQIAEKRSSGAGSFMKTIITGCFALVVIILVTHMKGCGK